MQESIQESSTEHSSQSWSRSCPTYREWRLSGATHYLLKALCSGLSVNKEQNLDTDPLDAAAVSQLLWSGPKYYLWGGRGGNGFSRRSSRRKEKKED